MTTQSTSRPTWPIDERLDRLIGLDIRVRAHSLSPIAWNGETTQIVVSGKELILPDNTRAVGLELHVEGRLRQYVRRVGMVQVELEAPSLGAGTAEGVVYFRGAQIVILKGPAMVQLAFPFRVEQLPGDLENYWVDIRSPRAQLDLPLWP